MKTKASNPATLLSKTSTPITEAFFAISHLKQLFRQGWLHHGIPLERCESVSEHTFGVALLAMILSGAYFPDLDQGKLLQMALIHDLGEIYAGDIVPGAGITSDEKYQLEKEAVSRIFRRIPNGGKLLSLWEEFETGESSESHFIRQIDKLEMVFQASIYENQLGVDLEDFFKSAGRVLESKELQIIFDELENLRKKE